jgi:hypothetical protein
MTRNKAMKPRRGPAENWGGSLRRHREPCARTAFRLGGIGPAFIGDRARRRAGAGAACDGRSDSACPGRRRGRYREELTEACWDGRIVSDDAISRSSPVSATSRIFQVADFTLETITE